jgi:hypothetical protein
MRNCLYAAFRAILGYLPLIPLTLIPVSQATFPIKYPWEHKKIRIRLLFTSSGILFLPINSAPLPYYASRTGKENIEMGSQRSGVVG